MTAAATDPAVSHLAESMMDAGKPKRLLAHGAGTHDGGAQATEVRSEKLSDSILGTREAILKVTEKGRWVRC
jgi:hypothetical protein